jgi:hypothetical protein
MARSGFGGWPLVGWAAVVIGLMVAIIFAVAGTDEAGLRLEIRATARTSVVLFTSAFVASAAFRRWPGPASRWLLANRRYLGVSFGVSHFAHLLGILALTGWSVTGFFREAGLVAGVLGGLGYVILAAMVATSFDATADWLGPRRWRQLHLAGAWYLWVIFFVSFAPRAAEAPVLYGGVTVLLLAALLIRLIARAPVPSRA